MRNTSTCQTKTRRSWFRGATLCTHNAHTYLGLPPTSRRRRYRVSCSLIVQRDEHEDSAPRKQVQPCGVV